MRHVRGWFLLALCVGAWGCPVTGTYPTCWQSPAQQGVNAFLKAEGRRVDPFHVVLLFTLATTRDERFTAVPDVSSNLGEMVDASSGGGTLEVTLRLFSQQPANGEVKLQGTLTADFRDVNDYNLEVDRCPYEATFDLSVSEQSVAVQQQR